MARGVTNQLAESTSGRICRRPPNLVQRADRARQGRSNRLLTAWGPWRKITSMGDPKRLHAEWQDFKNKLGATMIKDAGLKFNGGLGPKLDTLEEKWGTDAGQKAANDIKVIVGKYKGVVNGAKPKKSEFREVSSKTPYHDQKTKALDILHKIEVVAGNHNVDKVKKAAK